MWKECKMWSLQGQCMIIQLKGLVRRIHPLTWGNRVEENWRERKRGRVHGVVGEGGM